MFTPLSAIRSYAALITENPIFLEEYFGFTSAQSIDQVSFFPPFLKTIVILPTRVFFLRSIMTTSFASGLFG